MKISQREILLRSVSMQQSVKAGTSLSVKEMQQLVADLFLCTQPNVSAVGKPTYIEMNREQLEKMFSR
jgi:DNA mismatch repair protein MutL